MAFGLKIINAGGFVQIDQDFSNYVIVATGSVTLTNNAPSTVSFSDNGALPLVFVKFNSTSEYVGLSALSNTSATFSKSTTTGSATVQYMIAVPASGISVSGTAFGLRVFTASGAVAFDSRLNYPRVSSVLVTAGAFTSNNSFAMTYAPSITNPWMLMSLFYGRKGIVDNGGGAGVQLCVGIRNEDSSTVRLALFAFASGPPNVNIVVNGSVTTAILTNP